MIESQQQIRTETALQLLTEPRRRQILHRIAESSNGTTVDQLKNELQNTESVNPNRNGNPAVRVIDLHHVHLPKLQEANVLEYDSTRGTVERGEHFQDVFSLLQVIESNREDTSIPSP